MVETGPKVAAVWFKDGGVQVGGVAGVRNNLRLMTEAERKAAAPGMKSFEISLRMSLHKSLGFLVLSYADRNEPKEVWIPREHISQLEMEPQ